MPLKSNKKIILASGSPRRKMLLRQAGLRFAVIPSGYEEDMSLALPPKKLAQHLALGKAKDVASKIAYPALVIGADTFVVFDNKLLGKPKSPQEAVAMLKSLSGKKHYVVTGYAVIDTQSKKVTKGVSTCNIWFRNLTDQEINDYVATGEPMDKAGAYAGQERGAQFIKKVSGDWYAMVGLPMSKIVPQIKANL